MQRHNDFKTSAKYQQRKTPKSFFPKQLTVASVKLMMSLHLSNQLILDRVGLVPRPPPQCFIAPVRKKN